MAIETVNPAIGERLREFPALTANDIEDRLAIAARKLAGSGGGIVEGVGDRRQTI